MSSLSSFPSIDSSVYTIQCKIFFLHSPTSLGFRNIANLSNAFKSGLPAKYASLTLLIQILNDHNAVWHNLILYYFAPGGLQPEVCFRPYFLLRHRSGSFEIIVQSFQNMPTQFPFSLASFWRGFFVFWMKYLPKYIARVCSLRYWPNCGRNFEVYPFTGISFRCGWLSGSRQLKSNSDSPLPDRRPCSSPRFSHMRSLAEVSLTPLCTRSHKTTTCDGMTDNMSPSFHPKTPPTLTRRHVKLHQRKWP